MTYKNISQYDVTVEMKMSVAATSFYARVEAISRGPRAICAVGCSLRIGLPLRNGVPKTFYRTK